MAPVTHFRNRTLDTAFEARAFDDPSTEDDGFNISGYAAIWNSPTIIREAGASFLESISPGAFRKTLQERGSKVAMQWSHGKDPKVGQLPIGVWKSLQEDERGLKVQGRLLQTPEGDAVRQAIAAGAVSSMSFSFQVVQESWRDRATGKTLTGDSVWRALSNSSSDGEPSLKREIKAVRLMEAGPVLFPAYAATSVGVRSESAGLDLQRRLRLALASLD